MISLETIEELEAKIMKALELISDLRSENNRLESDNEALRAENDKMKLAMEEKEREIATLREKLAEAQKELQEFKTKEGKLDSKISDMMSRLDNLPSAKSSSTVKQGFSSSIPTPVQEAIATTPPVVKQEQFDSVQVQDSSEPTNLLSHSVTHETSSNFSEENDEIILLDDDEDEFTNTPEVVVKNESQIAESPKVETAPISEPSPNSNQIVEDSDDIIIDESDDDTINLFDPDEDDDFLIIDEDIK